jgi:Protein of unknown function (DUF3325)
MIVLTIVLSILSWAVVSAAMPKHGNAILKRQLSEAGQRRLRWSGICLLFLGAYALMAEKGWEFGLVYWLGVIMLTAIAWVLMLTWVTSGKSL